MLLSQCHLFFSFLIVLFLFYSFVEIRETIIHRKKRGYGDRNEIEIEKKKIEEKLSDFSYDWFFKLLLNHSKPSYRPSPEVAQVA